MGPADGHALRVISFSSSACGNELSRIYTKNARHVLDGADPPVGGVAAGTRKQVDRVADYSAGRFLYGAIRYQRTYLRDGQVQVDVGLHRGLPYLLLIPRLHRLQKADGKLDPVLNEGVDDGIQYRR